MSGHYLQDLLDQAASTTESRKRISFGEIFQAVGHGSFGSLLLLAGLIAFSPLGAIPGIPTAMGSLVVLTGGQLLLGRSCCWLPWWIKKRSVDSGKLRKAIGWLYRPARVVDRWLRRRLQVLVAQPGIRFLALACVLIGACMPLMEFVPFSVHSAGAVVSLFGLAVIARDGRPAAVGYALIGLAVSLAVGELT